MRIGMLVATVLCAVAANAATYRVTPDAVGGGNGLAWTDDGAGNAPMTLAEAVTVAKAADDTVVMLKAGRYLLASGLSLTRPFTLLGGYDGLGDVSLDATSPVSVLDGQDTVENLLTIKYNYSVVHTTTVSRIEFTRAAKRGVYSDTGSCYNLCLVFADCRFTANGMNWASNAQDGGRGFYARAPRSDRYNSLSLTNCYFGGNVTTNSASAGHSGKGALWTYAWSNLDLVDCTFETNGVAWWQPLKGGPVNRAGGGTALRVECGPVSLTRCVFRANRNGSMSESGYGDACVQIYNKEASENGDGDCGKLIRNVSSNEWHQVSVDFTTGDSGECTVWMGNWSKIMSGTFWFDDARIEALPLRELATREGTPFAVRNATTGKAYAMGRDYLSPVCEDDRIVIGVPAGSAIAEGEPVLVDAYVWARSGIKSQISTCMSDPQLYELFRKSAEGIVEACNPRKWFLSMDEIRNGGTCPLCAARKTDMAHIVAGCLLRQHEIIRSVRPDAKIYAWSDAFDPWHNAKERYGGCQGSFVGIWDLIPRDISLVCWHFAIRDKDLPFFVERGFGIVAGAYYDRKDVSRDEEWVRTLNKTKGATGMLYTTWNARYDQLENFGNMVWEKGRACGAFELRPD